MSDPMEELFSAFGGAHTPAHEAVDQTPARHDPDEEETSAATARLLTRLGRRAHEPVPAARRPRRGAAFGRLLAAACAAGLAFGLWWGAGPAQPPTGQGSATLPALSPAPASPTNRSVFLRITEPPRPTPAATPAPTSPTPRRAAPSAAPITRPEGAWSAPPTPTPEIQVELRATRRPTPEWPGLDPGQGSRVELRDRTALLHRGTLGFEREGELQPPADEVELPSLGLTLLPLGTVFFTGADDDFGAVVVLAGEVALIARQGGLLTRLGPGDQALLRAGPEGPVVIDLRGRALQSLPPAERALVRTLRRSMVRYRAPGATDCQGPTGFVCPGLPCAPACPVPQPALCPSLPCPQPARARAGGAAQAAGSRSITTSSGGHSTRSRGAR